MQQVESGIFKNRKYKIDVQNFHKKKNKQKNNNVWTLSCYHDNVVMLS
jgi:hypothetical protein